MAEWPKAYRPRRDVPPNMYTVYILKSESTNRYYTGQTNDIDDRIRRHNSGYEISTKDGMPWQIIHREEFTSRADAMNREREIKNFKGGNAFKKLIS